MKVPETTYDALLLLLHMRRVHAIMHIFIKLIALDINGTKPRKRRE